jgi:hypothetical protein
MSEAPQQHQPKTLSTLPDSPPNEQQVPPALALAKTLCHLAKHNTTNATLACSLHDAPGPALPRIAEDLESMLQDMEEQRLAAILLDEMEKVDEDVGEEDSAQGVTPQASTARGIAKKPRQVAARVEERRGGTAVRMGEERWWKVARAVRMVVQKRYPLCWERVLEV